MSRRIAVVALPCLVVVALVGCEGKSTARGSAPSGPPPPASEAEAEPAPSPEAAPAPAGVDAAIEALCVLPPGEPPADLATACRNVATAYDGYMNRITADDEAAKTEWAGKRAGQMQITELLCTKTGQIEVARCQTHAFEHATAEQEDALKAIMARCVDKFGA